MIHKEYNITKKEFYRFLEQLKAGNIKDTVLMIQSESYEGTAYKIGDEGTILLCEALKKNPHIKTVILYSQCITDIGAKALAEVDTVEELILSGNLIQLLGAVALAKSNLKAVSLSSNSLVEYYDQINSEYKHHETEEIEKMMQAFIDNKTITDLSLVGADISGALIARLINNNNTIITLNIQYNYAGDEALQYIGNNKTIRKLLIAENNITDVGAKYLVENTSLKTLVLHSNEITDVGAKILSTHSSLKHLVLIKNNLTIKGMRYFLDSKLDTIEVDYNKATREEILIFYDEFKQMLKSREVLQTIESETHDHDLVGDINNPDI